MTQPEEAPVSSENLRSVAVAGSAGEVQPGNAPEHDHVRFGRAGRVLYERIRRECVYRQATRCRRWASSELGCWTSWATR